MCCSVSLNLNDQHEETHGAARVPGPSARWTRPHRGHSSTECFTVTAEVRPVLQLKTTKRKPGEQGEVMSRECSPVERLPQNRECWTDGWDTCCVNSEIRILRSGQTDWQRSCSYTDSFTTEVFITTDQLETDNPLVWWIRISAEELAGFSVNNNWWLCFLDSLWAPPPR